MHFSVAVHAVPTLIMSCLPRWSLLSLTESKSKLFISSVSCRLPNMFTVAHLQEGDISRSDANILAVAVRRKVADLGGKWRTANE